MSRLVVYLSFISCLVTRRTSATPRDKTQALCRAIDKKSPGLQLVNMDMSMTSVLCLTRLPASRDTATPATPPQDSTNTIPKSAQFFKFKDKEWLIFFNSFPPSFL